MQTNCGYVHVEIVELQGGYIRYLQSIVELSNTLISHLKSVRLGSLTELISASLVWFQL